MYSVRLTTSVLFPNRFLHFGNKTATESLPLADVLSERYAPWVRKNHIATPQDLEAAMQTGFVRNNLNFLLRVGKAWKAAGYRFWPYAQQIFTSIGQNPSAPLRERAYAFLAMGQSCSEPGKQLDWYSQALDCAYQSGEMLTVTDVHLDTAAVQTLDKGRRNYHLSAALGLAKDLRDYARQARAEMGLGNLEENKTKKELHYLEAKRLASQAKNLGLEGRAINALGKMQENREDRIKYHQEALQIGEKARDKFLIAQSCWELGYVLTRNQKPYLKRALDLGYQQKEFHIVFKSYVELGNFARKVEKDLAGAHSYFSMAYEYAPEAEKDYIFSTLTDIQDEMNPIEEPLENQRTCFFKNQKYLPKRFRTKPSKFFSNK